MVENAEPRVFDRPLSCLAIPHLDRLAAHLSSMPGLGAEEAAEIGRATGEAVYTILSRKLSRLLVLELNAARIENRLEGETPEARWADFLDGASTGEFWEAMAEEYPAYPDRVARLVENQCAAATAFAEDFAADRDLLGRLLGGGPAGRLVRVEFASGDRHCGGKTVAMVETEAGPVVYKPRSVAADIALRGLIGALDAKLAAPTPIDVPAVVDKGDRGWAAFVAHELAQGDEELESFYRGVGHWIGLMRALGGTDFHGENLIASRGRPVLVDCETLFTPNVAPFPSTLGEAFDKCSALVSGSVLAIGLLPERGQGLGWRGVDMSGVGGLPDQQPFIKLPGLVDVGTDRCRFDLVERRRPPGKNHPSDEQVLSRFWPKVLEGFDEMEAALRDLDRSNALRPLLAPFEDCRVRVVVRATEVYAELERMLWHPVSLKDEAAAKGRTEDLLAEMGRNVSFAPSDPEVIAAEVRDLCDGDVPFFSTIARDGRLEGPDGTRWLPARNLVDAALDDWRSSDVETERAFVRAAIVSAYVNDGWLPERPSLAARGAGPMDPEASRRRHAAGVVRRIIDNATMAEDGTVAWIAPSLTPTGWSVTPLGSDLYGGLCGVALLAGAYVRERDAGRADDVAGVDDLLSRLLHTLRLSEDRQDRQRTTGALVRPPATGGYVGLGSQIWTRLTLARLGVDPDGIARARKLAESIEWAAEADDSDDLLYGRAGAIVPLLSLAAATDDTAVLDLAIWLGNKVVDAARREDGRAYWTHSSKYPEGIGGFAHGVSGIGWALHRLARASGRERFLDAASAAFAFEDALFDAEAGNWIDLRNISGPKHGSAWCHGAVGIGLARADLDSGHESERAREMLRHAAEAARRDGMGWNHCLCHGDFGAFELVDLALRHDVGPKGLTRESLRDGLLASLDEVGPACGVVREAFVPGMLVGESGVAYQLLRMHPDSDLPSVLTLGEADLEPVG